ncbi:MAG: hypothetical protein AAGA69_03385 [Pseudomonadota bacterium]
MTDQLGIQGDVRPGDEPLPFLSNFQDIFLSIGIVIFLSGMGILVGRLGAEIVPDAASMMATIAGLLFLMLVVVWILSEIIVRKRRRILPGIILCVTFLILTCAIFVNLYGAAVGENALDQLDQIEWTEPDVEDEDVTHEVLREVAGDAMAVLPWTVKGFLIAITAFMLASAFVYYRRFRLPFASAMVGLGVVGVIACILLLALPYDTIRFSPSIGLLSGLALLVAGVSYDMRDPERVTRWSGNGFWLHFVAAPLLLSSALTITTTGFAYDIPQMIQGDFDQWDNPFSVGQSVVTLVVIGVFAIISLLLNRRALVVAGLVSAGFAIAVIVNSSGLGEAEVAAVTLIALGGGILLLGLGWNAARKALLVFVPSGGFWGRIFPRETVDG